MCSYLELAVEEGSKSSTGSEVSSEVLLKRGASDIAAKLILLSQLLTIIKVQTSHTYLCSSIKLLARGGYMVCVEV